jgi:hypothetical protein
MTSMCIGETQRWGRMNVDEVTGAAVGALGSYFQQIASGVAARVRDSAVERLYALVAARLQGSEEAGQALVDLERRPDEPKSVSEIQRALARAVEDDPALAAELDRLVRANQAEREAASGVPAGGGGADVKVGPHGSLDMRRGVIAGGGVDQSHRFHFGVGGLAALIAAVALVAAGVSAAVTHGVLTPGTGEKRGLGGAGTAPSPGAGSTTSTGSALCSPRPCGEAEGIEIYLSGVQIQPPRDGPGELRFSWRNVNKSNTEFHFEDYISDAYDTTNAVIGVSGMPDCGDGTGPSEVRVTPGSESSTIPTCHRYSSLDGHKPATIEFGVDYTLVVELT